MVMPGQMAVCTLQVLRVSHGSQRPAVEMNEYSSLVSTEFRIAHCCAAAKVFWVLAWPLAWSESEF